MRKTTALVVALVAAATCFGHVPRAQAPVRSDPLFGPEGRPLTKGRVFAIAGADLDGDKRPDVVVTDFLAPARVLFNDAKQAFTKVLTLTSTPDTATEGHGVAIADFNGDRRPDLFLVYNGKPSRLLLGDGLGHFIDSGRAIGETGLNGTGVEAADIDGDGDVDVLVSHYQQPDRIYLNDGKGTFAPGQAFEGNATLGDVDRDGNPDLVCVPGNGEGPASIWLNANGRFARQAETIDVEQGFFLLKFADVDGDGDLDLVALNRTTQTTLWANDGKGRFVKMPQALGAGIRVTAGDMDLDGDPDLIVGSTVWLNVGRGRFEKGQTFDFGEATALLLMDADGDDDLDLFAVRGNREQGWTELLLFENRLRR